MNFSGEEILQQIRISCVFVALVYTGNYSVSTSLMSNCDPLWNTTEIYKSAENCIFCCENPGAPALRPIINHSKLTC